MGPTKPVQPEDATHAPSVTTRASDDVTLGGVSERPPATEPIRIAERLARSLGERGARAVALVGSQATGRATAESDLDLAVIGDGPHYRLELHGGVLVSLGWAPAEEQHRRLYDPAYLGNTIPTVSPRRSTRRRSLGGGNSSPIAAMSGSLRA